MKNIHVLSTDKPSRLIIYSTLLNEFRLLDAPIDDWKHKRNIYITSNEEISRDTKPCWCLDDKDNSVNYYQGALPLHNYIGYKKIILTTDQDLIKDGVQPIDDEFLEWFIKNSNCKEVYIHKEYKQINQDNPITRGSTALVFSHYEIIIPQ